MEEKRHNETDGARKYYQGLPITSMAMALPILFVLSPLFHSHQLFMITLHALVAIVGTLFITNFKFRKPTTIEIFLIVAIVAAAVLAILSLRHSWWKILHIRR